jgi:hypothetical protein
MSITHTINANKEIISITASFKNFHYNGENLFTYPEWLQKGYRVKRGQHAFIKTRLWTLGKNRRFVLVSLFTANQVEKTNKNQFAVV